MNFINVMMIAFLPHIDYNLAPINLNNENFFYNNTNNPFLPFTDLLLNSKVDVELAIILPFKRRPKIRRINVI